MSSPATHTNGRTPIANAELWITGLGSQYPPYSLRPEDLDKFASSFYDPQSPGQVVQLKTEGKRKADLVIAD